MKGLIITNKGMEHISALEVKDLLGIEKGIKIDEDVVRFPINKLEDLALLCYKSQSASKVIYLLGEIKVTKNLESNIKKFSRVLENIQLGDFLKNKIFRVDCKRIGKHNFKSVDISREIANLLIKKGYDKVTFKNPRVVLYVFIDDKKGYIGIDFSGDISKRDYRIFNNSKSIKGNIAYALIREAGYDGDRILVDPFCKSGEIPIEATLFASNFSVNFFKNEKGFLFTNFMKFDFEKENKKIKKKKLKIFGYDSLQRNIIAARKNSKVAGIDKLLNFENYDLSWLEIKHDKNSVDIIVTKLPELSKKKRKEQIEHIYKEFFEKSNIILKKKGKMVLISKDFDIIKKTKGKFKIVKSFIIYSGKMPLNIHVLEK